MLFFQFKRAEIHLANTNKYNLTYSTYLNINLMLIQSDIIL